MTHDRILSLRNFALLLVLIALPASATAQVWEAAEGYSATQNPNGPWTYGWSSTLGGNFTPFSNYGAFCGGVTGWRLPLAPYPHPSVAKNDFTITKCCPTLRMPPGKLISHPGPQGQYAILRWTAPAAGDYHVAVGFGGLDFQWPTSSNVALLHNDVPLMASELQGYHGPSNCSATNYSTPVGYTGVLALAAGDTIDAAVGYGQNGFFNGDSTLVELVVTLAARCRHWGTSCGAPATLAMSTPVLGYASNLSLSGAPPIVSGTLFVSAPPPAPILIGGSCNLYVDLVTLAPFVPITTDSSGDWGISVPLPANYALSGLNGILQAFLFPAPTPLGYVITNGLDVTL